MRARNNVKQIVLVLLSGAGLLMGLAPWDRPAVAQPGAGGPTPAAVAKLPQNRGKVVGAPCDHFDGYVPDFSKLEAKARAAMQAGGGQRPINLLDLVDADTPMPLQIHQLPPGRPYCLRTPESPDGYLTMNCTVDSDCRGQAACQGGICRAECTQDTDCEAPTVCTRIGSPAKRFCRCDGCLHKGGDSVPATAVATRTPDGKGSVKASPVAEGKNGKAPAPGARKTAKRTRNAEK